MKQITYKIIDLLLCAMCLVEYWSLTSILSLCNWLSTIWSSIESNYIGVLPVSMHEPNSTEIIFKWLDSDCIDLRRQYVFAVGHWPKIQYSGSLINVHGRYKGPTVFNLDQRVTNGPYQSGEIFHQSYLFIRSSCTWSQIQVVHRWLIKDCDYLPRPQANLYSL